MGHVVARGAPNHRRERLPISKIGPAMVPARTGETLGSAVSWDEASMTTSTLGLLPRCRCPPAFSLGGPLGSMGPAARNVGGTGSEPKPRSTVLASFTTITDGGARWKEG
jgi:hypothetical protein